MNDSIYIVGAHSRGKTLGRCLRELYPEMKIMAYLYDNDEPNADTVDGVPVVCFDTGTALDKTAVVYVATKAVSHKRLTEKLRGMGMEHIVPVTAAVDNFFRNAYVARRYAREMRPFVKITDLSARRPDAAVYVVKSIYDKPLQTRYACPCYEKVIQAGAALTQERLSPDGLTDCAGENISARNRQYSELTALYWIWKHAREEIVGLAHYRRHFILPDHWQDIMQTNDIDVILPVPTLVYPGIAENYRERHDAADWEYLMRYLRENCPGDYAQAEAVFAGNLYFPCNMFIMRREILNDLCRWLFPILDAVTENGGEKADTYQNRYPGFLSERLLTLYFRKNDDRYRIVYADRDFIV